MSATGDPGGHRKAKAGHEHAAKTHDLAWADSQRRRAQDHEREGQT